MVSHEGLIVLSVSSRIYFARVLDGTTGVSSGIGFQVPFPTVS